MCFPPGHAEPSCVASPPVSPSAVWSPPVCAWEALSSRRRFAQSARLNLQGEARRSRRKMVSLPRMYRAERGPDSGSRPVCIYQDGRRLGPLKCGVFAGVGRMRYRKSVVDEYRSGRGPPLIWMAMFAARPWLVGIRRASAADIRLGSLRVRGHLPPAEAYCPSDIFGKYRPAAFG